MKIYSLPRQGGKTSALVDLMLEPGNEDIIYIAPTMAQADNARRMAQERGATPERAKRGRFQKLPDRPIRGRSNVRYVVDELDGILSYLLGGIPVAVAVTGE
jgi:hypothetical protein